MLRSRCCVRARVNAHCFGALTGKIYDFRGTWRGLDMFQNIAGMLKQETAGRVVAKLAGKSKNGRLRCSAQ